MKIALIGYGKMGHMIEEIARQRGHEIVCIIDVNNSEDFDSEAFSSADVAIEFTNPTAAYGNYLKAFKHHVKVVSGSTGWMKDHKADVEALTKDGQQTLFWASNFSIGVAIFEAVNRYLAKIMNGFPQYDVTMEEVHHVHKLDAPSGTAITLAEEIIENLDRKTEWVKGFQHHADGKEEGTNAVSPEKLPIATKFRAFTAFNTTAMPTQLPSLTTHTIAKDLLWALCSRPNIQKIILDCSPQATCLNSKLS